LQVEIGSADEEGGPPHNRIIAGRTNKGCIFVRVTKMKVSKKLTEDGSV
jgi:hypothetical protein